MRERRKKEKTQKGMEAGGAREGADLYQVAAEHKGDVKSKRGSEGREKRGDELML